MTAMQIELQQAAGPTTSCCAWPFPVPAAMRCREARCRKLRPVEGDAAAMGVIVRSEGFSHREAWTFNKADRKTRRPKDREKGRQRKGRWEKRASASLSLLVFLSRRRQGDMMT